MGKRELVALLNLSSWCLVMVERLFLAVPWDFLRFVIVVFPDHTHYFWLTLADRVSIFCDIIFVLTLYSLNGFFLLIRCINFGTVHYIYRGSQLTI